MLKQKNSDNCKVLLLQVNAIRCSLNLPKLTKLCASAEADLGLLQHPRWSAL